MPTGICPECEADIHVDTDADKGTPSRAKTAELSWNRRTDPVELDIVEEKTWTMTRKRRKN